MKRMLLKKSASCSRPWHQEWCVRLKAVNTLHRCQCPQYRNANTAQCHNVIAARPALRYGEWRRKWRHQKFPRYRPWLSSHSRRRYATRTALRPALLQPFPTLFSSLPSSTVPLPTLPSPSSPSPVPSSLSQTHSFTLSFAETSELPSTIWL